MYKYNFTLKKYSSKRTNFKNIQDSHSIGIAGAFPPPTMTGYEYAVAHRVDDKFAWVSKENGTVISLDDNHIGIKYESGEIVRIKLGSYYGTSAGKVIDNPIITDYQVGQSVKKGDVVCFNKKFFVRDIFEKNQVLFKYATLCRVAFMESNDTEEDGCAVSPRLSEKLTTETVKVRTLTIPFNMDVYNMLNKGNTVTSDSILCTLVDSVISDNSMFGEDDLDTLKELMQNTPRAKSPGVIKNIEVFYYGDPETAEITESVKKIIKRYDAIRGREARAIKDGRPETGQLMESIRVENNPLPLNTLVVKFYIHHNDGYGVGD